LVLYVKLERHVVGVLRLENGSLLKGEEGGGICGQAYVTAAAAER